MRFVFVGSSGLSLASAAQLIRRGHDVVIVERDKGRIETLMEEHDCGFIHGDGSKPTILREAGPEITDLLFCLTGNDQTNILASLVGRSLGFPQTVIGIEDTEFEHICLELGLDSYIVPARTIGRHLADFAEGHNSVELSSMIKGEARLFTFVVDRDEQGVTIEGMRLPRMARVICVYRDGEFLWPTTDLSLLEGDEVVVITHAEQLASLKELWGRGRASRGAYPKSPHPKPLEEGGDERIF